MRRELTTRQLLFSFVLYAALTVLLAYPFSVHVAGTALSRGTDADLWVWTLGWDVHALTHRPWAIFDANIFFPFHNTLAYSENLIGSAIVAAPIIWLGGSAALAMNLIELGSIAVSALGANVLGRRLGLSAPAAILCGLVFGFAPPRFLRIDQLHLTTIQWVPFAMACLHAYVDGGRARDLRAALALFSLQALTSGHGAAFLSFAMAALVAWRLALGDPPAIGRRVRDVGLPGVLLLLPALLVYLPYRAAQLEVGLRRQLDDVRLSASSFFASGSHVQTWLLAHAPRWEWLTGEPDAWLFPGVVPVMLAALACARLRVVRDEAAGREAGIAPGDCWFYLLLATLCWLLAMGPAFVLWRLVYWWPGFSFVRVPSRFVLLGVLALGVLAGAGYDRVTARGRARRGLWALAIGAVFLVESAALPLTPSPYLIEQPAIERWLAAQPGRFAILELPIPDSRSVVTRELRNTRYMLHSMMHWHPIWEGYSGVQPPGFMDGWWQLTGFPDAASLATVRRLGISHVILHTDLIPAAERTGVEERFARWSADVALEHVEGEGRLYSIRTR